jgi:hypothetical protein
VLRDVIKKLEMMDVHGWLVRLLTNPARRVKMRDVQMRDALNLNICFEGCTGG